MDDKPVLYHLLNVSDDYCYHSHSMSRQASCGSTSFQRHAAQTTANSRGLGWQVSQSSMHPTNRVAERKSAQLGIQAWDTAVGNQTPPV